MTRAGQVAAGLGAAALLLYLTRPKGTVTTSETFELPPTGYPEPLKRTAEAIARAEGFYVPGSVPQRANNPGDLKLGGTTIANGITVFDSAGAGWAALYRQLGLIVTGASAYYNLDMTIADMGRRWTATTSEQSAWSTNVAHTLGVSVNAPLWSILI